MAEEITKKSNKTAIIVTYIIALLCLVAGLFVPLYGEIGSNAMLIQRLPDAFNQAIGSELIPSFSEWFVPFAEESPYALFGQSVNIFAWCTVLYAVITVVGLFFLIPVFLGNKQKKTSAACAYFIEAVAVTVLVIYYLFKLGTVSTADIGSWNLNTLIALGGALLMLIVQSIMTKKGLGAAKLFLFIFSAISALMLFDIVVFVSMLEEPLASLATPLQSSVGFIGSGSAATIGWLYTVMLFNPQTLGTIFEIGEWQIITLTIALLLVAGLVFINIIIDTAALATGAKYDKNGNIRYNNGSKIFNLVRYSLLLLGVVVAVIMLFITEGYNVGLYLYVIALITLIQFVMSLIRLILVGKAKKAAEAKRPLSFNDAVLESEHNEDLEIINDTPATNYSYDATDYEEPEAEETVYGNYTEPVKEEPEPAAYEPAYEPEPEPEEEPAYEQPAPQPAPAAKSENNKRIVYSNYNLNEDVEGPESYFDGMDEEEPEDEQTPAGGSPEETHTIDYKVKYVYNGPSDEFMDTLTDEEKIEFSKTFIEKLKGNLPRVPDYEIGGDNEDFFPAIFIYLNRFRSLLSPALLNKIYKYMNIVK